MYYDVFWPYLKAFIWSLGLISIIYIIVVLNKQIYVSEMTRKIMEIGAIVFELTALYGKLGGRHQKWSGNSLAEDWDDMLFYFFSSIGIILAIIPLIV
jgi:hypothetical protein